MSIGRRIDRDTLMSIGRSIGRDTLMVRRGGSNLMRNKTVKHSPHFLKICFKFLDLLFEFGNTLFIGFTSNMSAYWLLLVLRYYVFNFSYPHVGQFPFASKTKNTVNRRRNVQRISMAIFISTSPIAVAISIIVQ